MAAPELNPQEHVWKAMREAVRYNHTAAELSTLAGRFAGHLTDTTFPTSFLAHRGFYTVHPRSIEHSIRI
jgi:transposase